MGRSSDYPSNWNSLRKEIYKRDNYTCKNCGNKGGPRGNAELHAHHGVPLSKGGSNKKSNLHTYCDQCHKAIHGDSTAPTSDETIRQGTIDPTVIIPLQLETMENKTVEADQDYTPEGLAVAMLLPIGVLLFIIAALLTRSIFRSISLVLPILILLFPYFYKRNESFVEDLDWSESVKEDLNRVNELVKPYNDKKREINSLIKLNRLKDREEKVPDKHIEEIEEIHNQIKEIVYNSNEKAFKSKFIRQIKMTEHDIKHLENGKLEFEK